MIWPFFFAAVSASATYSATAFSQPMHAPSSALAMPMTGKLEQPRDRLGVWLTTVDSQVLYDAKEQSRALEFLRSNGFSRAAVPLYTGGYLTWQLGSGHGGIQVPLDPQLSAANSSKRFLQSLGKNGIKRVGWFEFGLMAPVSAAWLQGREQLLLLDRDGSSLWQESPKLNRVWLNPLQPEVQNLITQMVVDACTTLPLDVIQFDDHLGYPAQFGYDSTTLNAWRQTEDGKKQPNPDPLQPEWISWRSKQVTALLQKIRKLMNQACPGVSLSISPNPQKFSYQNYLADWHDWARRGLVDEVVVQIYRNNLISLGLELTQIQLDAVNSLVPVRIGLLAGLRNQPKSVEQLQKEIKLVQSVGFEGVDLFFYESARTHFHDGEILPTVLPTPVLTTPVHPTPVQPAISQPIGEPKL
jgi:uncharacterized lipoprotein YddW (UPF0748 family)